MDKKIFERLSGKAAYNDRAPKSEEILTKDALLRGNITETQTQYQNHQLSLLADQLKQLIKAEVSVQ